MSQVVDAAEEFAVELRVADGGHRAVLVEGARVALEARREVGEVRRDLLDHQPSESNQI